MPLQLAPPFIQSSPAYHCSKGPVLHGSDHQIPEIGLEFSRSIDFKIGDGATGIFIMVCFRGPPFWESRNPLGSRGRGSPSDGTILRAALGDPRPRFPSLFYLGSFPTPSRHQGPSTCSLGPSLIWALEASVFLFGRGWHCEVSFVFSTSV